MSTGARGLTLVRAAVAPSAPDASTVAWELAARARFDRALSDAHDTLATLAFDVAEGIIGRAVTVDAAVLGALVAQAVARARGARRILACVHPDDVVTARLALAEALSDGAPLEWVEVAADPSLPRGAVAVETERGRVTADWAASLALARSRWVASLPEPRG
ncbi:MAG: FliH/SctL family protein [Myxococcales bacterium]|nr:FliH/SctL family protein [Myxococcales bacterium]